jgi:hypothetical protein
VEDATDKWGRGVDETEGGTRLSVTEREKALPTCQTARERRGSSTHASKPAAGLGLLLALRGGYWACGVESKEWVGPGRREKERESLFFFPFFYFKAIFKSFLKQF